MSRIGQGIKKSVLTANSVLYAVTASVPAALSMAASRILGRKSTGDIDDLTAAELLTIINVTEGADVTGSNTPQAHKGSHENTGGDEIDVVGLSGLLADDQHVLDSEVIAVAIDKTIQTTKGDLLPVSAASTQVRLGVGANDEVLTADSTQGSGLKWAAGGGVATKEFFVPIEPYTLGTFAALGDFAGATINSGEEAYVAFSVPNDFSSITEAVVLIIPSSTELYNIDTLSDYGAHNEARTTHSESETVSTYNLTTDQLEEIGVSGILSSLAAGDYVGISIECVNANPVTVIGLRFKYS